LRSFGFYLLWIFSQQGVGRADPIRRYGYLQANTLRQQEVFESFVPAEKTGQLASPRASAYTDFAAIAHRFFGFAVGKPGRTSAAERACPLRKPSLTQVISSENFILLPAYSPLAHS
jgi:hypothetical protein